MRDKRFVAVHRGGRLTIDNHYKLMRWARHCSKHALLLIAENIDLRLIHALHVAKEWENNKVPTGDAMKASLGAHAVAREAANPVLKAVARSIAQAVATSHMADHSVGAALYALKAVKLAGKSIDAEKEWQNQQLRELPLEYVEVVLTTIKEKQKGII